MQLSLDKIQFPPGMSDEAKIVWARDNKYTIREIKKHLKFGSDKINRVIKEYNKNQIIPTPLKSHPATKLTNEMLLHINQCILTDAHVTLQQMADKAFEKFNVNISPTSISNGCHKLRYQYKPPQKTQLLTDIHKINRISFANTLLQMNSNNQIDLTKIIFSDESRFVQGDDKQWVWRRYGERNPTALCQCQKFPQSIMIYGAIGLNYKSKLVIVKGSIDSRCYQKNILDSEMINDLDELYGRENWIFQQDGARCHTSKETIQWLKSKCLFIKRWPANSPDLNPIENFWAVLKAAVYKLKPQNIDELEKIIIRVWNDYDQEKINNLVLSFYQRLQLIIENKGESIQPQLVRGLYQLNITLSQIPPDAEYWSDIISKISNKDEQMIINKGPFNKDEDDIILDSVKKYGRKWTLIALKFPDRTPIQIRYRYDTHLKTQYI